MRESLETTGHFKTSENGTRDRKNLYESMVVPCWHPFTKIGNFIAPSAVTGLACSCLAKVAGEEGRRTVVAIQILRHLLPPWAHAAAGDGP